MSLGKKFTLATVSCLLVLMGAGAWHLNRLQDEMFVEEAKARAEVVLSFSQACRTYAKKVLRPAVQRHTEAMVFEAMSSTFVTRGILGFFKKKMPDYSYRQPTLNPLNLANKADEFEAKLVAGFRADRDLGEASGYRVVGGEEQFYVARPIVVESKCLSCHGSAESAPPEIPLRYGAAQE